MLIEIFKIYKVEENHDIYMLNEIDRKSPRWNVTYSNSLVFFKVLMLLLQTNLCLFGGVTVSTHFDESGSPL